MVEFKVPAGHILRAAEKLDEPVGTILQCLQKFTLFGLVLPNADPEKFSDLTVTQEDSVLFNGIDNKVSVGHILRTAVKLNEPVGTILQRLQRFAPLGLVVPDVDPEQFLDLTVTQNDLVLFSRYLNGRSPWIDNEVSVGHISQAAVKLNEPFETILQRIRQFAPLGLDVPL